MDEDLQTYSLAPYHFFELLSHPFEKHVAKEAVFLARHVEQLQ